MTPESVITEARSWVGVKFRHQGRTREGMDCAGLLLYVARELELSSIEPPPYRRVPARVGNSTIQATCETHMRSIDARYMGPGDVALFAFFGRPWHLAIVAPYGTAELSIVHAYEPAGRVVQTRLDEVWRSRMVAAYALPGVC